MKLRHAPHGIALPVCQSLVHARLARIAGWCCRPRQLHHEMILASDSSSPTMTNYGNDGSALALKPCSWLTLVRSAPSASLFRSHRVRRSASGRCFNRGKTMIFYIIGVVVVIAVVASYLGMHF
jgi:hypothetical protein